MSFQINYTIDKDMANPNWKGCITCDIAVNPAEAEDDLNILFNKLGILFKFDGFSWFTNNHFIGKAYCSLDDEWDEEKGKRLAFLRAQRKFFQDKQMIITEYIKAANDVHAEIIRYNGKLLHQKSNNGLDIVKEEDRGDALPNFDWL